MTTATAAPSRTGPKPGRTPSHLGDAILSLGIAEKEVAIRIGVSYQTVWKMVYAPGYFPRPPVARALADLLGCSVSSIPRMCRRDGRGRCRSCGGYLPTHSSARSDRHTGLCRVCYEESLRMQQLELTCEYQPCGERFRRNRKKAEKVTHHFCCREHFYAWRRGRRHPRRSR